MLCFQTEPAESSASIFKPARKTPPEQPIKRALVQIVLAIHRFAPVEPGTISRYASDKASPYERLGRTEGSCHKAPN